MRTKLSENFYLDEFTKSDVAKKRGIRNIPSESAAGNLSALCVNVLQPVREAAGKPVTISSGYRCPELNEAVGGKATSQHIKGEAADIFCAGVSAKGLFDLIRSLGIAFDQLILYPTFVHVSYREGENRGQALYAKGVKP